MLTMALTGYKIPMTKVRPLLVSEILAASNPIKDDGGHGTADAKAATIKGLHFATN